MIRFNEYVQRRDEASYNPFQRIGTGSGAGRLGGETGDLAKVVGHVPAGVAMAPYAAARGLGQASSTFRNMAFGNPYITQDSGKTKALATNAFNQSTDWLLNFVHQEQMPRMKQELVRFLQGTLVRLNERFKKQVAEPEQIAGVTVGKQPTTMGNVFALPVSIISGIKAAAKNVIDTLNPVYEAGANEWAANVGKMILSLDALNSWEKSQPGENQQLVDAYIQTFLHHLQAGGGAAAREIGRS